MHQHLEYHTLIEQLSRIVNILENIILRLLFNILLTS